MSAILEMQRLGGNGTNVRLVSKYPNDTLGSWYVAPGDTVKLEKLKKEARDARIAEADADWHLETRGSQPLTQGAKMKLDTFTRAYLEAVDFTEKPDGKSITISKAAIKQAVADCAKFQAENDLADYPVERAGHDFWFTRNGHGVGFWEEDFSTPEVCAKLDKAASDFGEVYCEISRGRLFFR